MTSWQIAMVCILPLMWGSMPYARTWAAMAGAALMGHLVPHIGAWMAIDLIAGTIVLMHPKSLPQRAIGALFAGMVLFTVGFIAGGQNAPAQYANALSWMGWAQFAILLWGRGNDILGRLVVFRGTDSGSPVHIEGRS